MTLDRLAFRATVHCLSGCSIGEILGMVLGSTWNWSNAATVALSIGLAFVFGYAFTIVPLLGAGIPPAGALRLALASDTLSIAVMEVVDNAIMWFVPGAMDAPLDSPRFWVTLLVSLVIAGAAAFPVNRWLIARGRGHALVHGAHHDGHHGSAA
ncbi:MAG: DUF4396 domain-containing protein [Candidatus Eiseniibacteriota bacterium]